MAKFSASSWLLLAFLVYISVKTAILHFVGGCSLAVLGGGCPNITACRMTCAPCYRGVGRVAPYCRAAGVGIPFESCVCSFSRGAPCPPRGPPRCPNTQAEATASFLISNTTHHVYRKLKCMYLNKDHIGINLMSSVK
ncbi:hypothetical protein PanWU01x14_004670 [Parasponia andersonii]|uniref:Uncharacterized protein n=1 Tax=Parasponia andersonii TaxID=3476 RepID=A0A2P5E3B7_PARAD|nr:hypothetical protein PanWU01x14_004670 [Parasponia andersonii]